MLDTLYKIGQQLSQQSREEFDDIILKPPIDETELEKGVQFLVVEVIFDLDNQEIRPGRKRPFDADDPIFEFSPYKLRCLRIQGGNNKSIYPTVDPRKSFDPWVKTFFGKDETATKPELVVAIEKDFSELREKLFFKIAEKIIELQPAFKLLFYFPKEGLEELVMDHKKGLKELFGLTDKDRVAMLTASIVAKDFGLDSPTVFAQLDGFDDFLRRKFLKAAVEGATDERAAKNPRLCYVSGKMAAEVRVSLDSGPALTN